MNFFSSKMLQSKNGVFYAVFWLLINYLASTDSIDLKLVSSLRSLLYLNRLILICKLENNLAARKMLLQHSLELDELGSASVFRGTASFSDAVSVSYLANNSVVFCAQDFDAEAFLSRSRKFGVKQPWVIVHKYDDEAAVARLGKLFNLNQQMFFFDLRTKQLSESYEIGGAAVSRNLGTLTLLNGNYAFSRDVKQGFLQRRSNLMGKRLKIVVDNQNPYLNLPQDLDLSSKFTTPSGDEIIPLSHDEISGVFFEQTMVLSRELNFSTSYFRRVDRVWGTYISQGNVTGMVGSAYKGEFDLVGTTLTLNPVRALGIDYLLPIGTETYALFIKTTGEEELAWQVFLLPFSRELWAFLLVNSVLCMVAIKLFEIYLSSKAKGCFKTIEDLVFYKWIVICSYFGKGPPKIPADERMPFKILLFSIFLVGNVVWMSYRASLTSELSNRVHKMPFSNLEELLQSDFQLTIRSGGFSSSLFLNSEPGTIFNRLFVKFLRDEPEKYTHPTVQEGLKNLMDIKHGAYYYILESVLTFSEYECKVTAPWISNYPNFLGMAMRKGSPYYDIFKYNLLRHMEKGTVQILNKRWKKTLPDCSVDRGVALGPEKLVSLFTVLCMGFFLATICFAFEVTFRGSDKSKLPDDDCGDKTEKRMWNKCTEREQLSRRYQTIMRKEFQNDKKLEFIHELEQFLLELKRQQKAKESR